MERQIAFINLKTLYERVKTREHFVAHFVYIFLKNYVSIWELSTRLTFFFLFDNRV